MKKVTPIWHMIVKTVKFGKELMIQMRNMMSKVLKPNDNVSINNQPGRPKYFLLLLLDLSRSHYENSYKLKYFHDKSSLVRFYMFLLDLEIKFRSKFHLASAVAVSQYDKQEVNSCLHHHIATHLGLVGYVPKLPESLIMFVIRFQVFLYLYLNLYCKKI